MVYLVQVFSRHLGFAKCGELGRVKESPPPPPPSLAFLPDSWSLLCSFALAPSLQCFPNPRWRLINTRWNIQRSLAQNTPALQKKWKKEVEKVVLVYTVWCKHSIKFWRILKHLLDILTFKFSQSACHVCIRLCKHVHHFLEMSYIPYCTLTASRFIFMLDWAETLVWDNVEVLLHVLVIIVWQGYLVLIMKSTW